MQCARCAIDYPDDQRLCTACGDPLASTDEAGAPFPRCSHCGYAVSTTDHFCPGCGTRHGDGPHPGDRQPPERRRAILVGAILWLVLALLLAYGIHAYRSRGARLAAAPAPSAASQPASGDVATANGIGIKIAGVGAGDPERSEAAVRSVVEQHLAELKQSYLAALQADATTEGVVTLHMTLAADGTVAYVRSTSLGLADRGLAAIVERQAAAWRFAPSRGLASVHYPLVFHLPKTNPHELAARLEASRGPEAGEIQSPPGAGEPPPEVSPRQS